MVTTTAAVLNPAVAGQEELAQQLVESISAKQQAVVPATPTIPAPQVEGEPVGGLALPDDIQKALSDQKATTDAISVQLQTTMDIGDASAKAMAEALSSRTRALKHNALVEDTAQLKAQNETIKVFQSAGGYDASVDRAEDALAFEQQLEELTQKRTDIMTTERVGNSIIDGVINGFLAYGTEVEIEQVAQQQAQNFNDINNATAITASAAQTNLLVKESVNAGTIAANQDIIAADGKIQAYEAHLKQNQSNALNLKTMMELSSQQMRGIRAGYELANSMERLDLDREILGFRREAAVAARETRAFDLQLKGIQVQRNQLLLEREQATNTTVINQQLANLALSEQALLKGVDTLAVLDATQDARIETLRIGKETSEVQLEKLKNQLDEELDPERKKALQAQYATAQTNAARTDYEFTELQETKADRLARNRGAAEALEIQNKLQTLTLEAATLQQEGKNAEALAKLDEARRIREDQAAVREAEGVAVQNFQSWIYGADKAESTEVINARLDAGDPVYERMRILGSLSKDGQFLLGPTPAKAKENLALFEQYAEPSQNIKGVAVLREVDRILEAEYAANPALIPVDEIAAAIQYNARVNQYVAENSADIVFDDPTNPMKPLTITQAVTSSPTYAEQPLTKELVKSGQTEADVNVMIEKGLVSMQAGTLELEDVVEGIVSFGDVNVIDLNARSSGFKAIGVSHQTSMNMRVLKPRGFASSVLNSVQTTLGGAVVPVGVGLAAAGLVLSAPVSAPLIAGSTGVGAAIGIGSGLGTGFTAAGAGAGAATLASSFLSPSSNQTVLNITDPVAVRQHLISILSSTTLGGESTPTNITGEQ